MVLKHPVRTLCLLAVISAVSYAVNQYFWNTVMDGVPDTENWSMLKMEGAVFVGVGSMLLFAGTAAFVIILLIIELYHKLRSCRAR